MFKRLSNQIFRRHRFIIFLAVGFIGVSVVYGTKVFDKLDPGGFEDKSTESYLAQEKLANNFTSGGADLIVLLTPKGGQLATDPAVAAAARASLDRLAGKSHVQSVTSFYSSGEPAFVSNDKTKAFAVVSLSGMEDEQSEYLPDIQKDLENPQLTFQLGGPAALNESFNKVIEDGLAKAEMISFSLLAVMLIVVFRSFVAGLLPLLLGGFAILGAFLVTRMLTGVMDVSQYAINVIIFLGLGLAVDYSLFMVSRFREELRSTGDTRRALAVTMATAGRTVLFSGVTVMISLLALMIFPLGFLKSMGAGGAAAVLVAMLGALLVLPAILVALGNRVNALSFGSIKRDREALAAGKVVKQERPSFWYRVCKQVMRRPRTVIIVTVGLLLVTGLPFLRAELQSPDYRSLPAGEEARTVSESLAGDFPQPGDPIEIVTTLDGPLQSPAQVASMKAYVRQLQAVPGVTSVETYTNAQSPAQFMSNDGRTALVNVRYRGVALDDTSKVLVDDIRRLAPPDGMEVHVGGPTAKLVDLLDALKTSIPIALVFIVLAMVVLLFLLLGSIVLPIKAVILNILSLSASFGLLVWIFQDGNLTGLLGFESVGSIDANQPILIFAIAFGLSMDYAVFLLSRVKEEYDKGKDTAEAVAVGVQKTGFIITSAAVLLLIVVGAFATIPLPLMKQLGVGLGAAIVVDAVIVRMLLVPASMCMLGKNNWWAPRPLKKLQAKLGLSE